MTEELKISGSNKRERYATLLTQVASLLDGETDLIAGMANMAAALTQTFGFFWVGFYRVIADRLVLGPFQGPIACTRIAFGKGVCGTAWERAETVIVPDVDAFPGHIACNSASRSEIVVPVKAAGEVIAVLDIDSDRLGAFDEVDRRYLEQMVALLTAHTTS
ncbi:MAG: GAF domain-containing protein [Parabacteroides sp.]